MNNCWAGLGALTRRRAVVQPDPVSLAHYRLPVKDRPIEVRRPRIRRSSADGRRREIILGQNGIARRRRGRTAGTDDTGTAAGLARRAWVNSMPPRRWRSWPSRSSRRNCWSRTQVDWKDGSPAWSPDGKRIAFYSERDGNAEIYVMNADGSGVTPPDRTTADEGYPAWSPDGRTITFDSDRDGNFEMFAMNADGSNAARLTRHRGARRVGVVVARRIGDRLHVGSRRRLRRLSQPAPDPAAARRASRGPGARGSPCSRPMATLAFHVGRDVHTIAAARRRRSAAADDGSRERDVSVVVARRQADRVHELAQRAARRSSR